MWRIRWLRQWVAFESIEGHRGPGVRADWTAQPTVGLEALARPDGPVRLPERSRTGIGCA
jgi:hypothetical protein